ncbi:MAG: ATP-binding cassette domain-containing protein [Anaerolineaceae bacterium]|nr:ATP-binding cassette domain-containing protein [Anaerolineaceae bacterium]
MSIVVNNLTKKFGAQRAVDNISFEVKTGEILGFLGPNGAGKTTTMKILTCYMAPSDGDAKINDLSILEYQDEIKKKIGYLPENNPLYHDMPVLEYLKFVADLQGVPKEKIQDRIGEMVYVCGLNVEKHKKIGELSKGFRQRVGLAQAMIHDPEILILDEPTTGLDPNQIVEIRKLIKEIGKQKTVILSTHILSEVEQICSRVLIINKGEIVAEDTPARLISRLEGGERVRLQTLSAPPNAVEILHSWDQVRKVVLLMPNTFDIECAAGADCRPFLAQFVVEQGWGVLELRSIEANLEDIFLQLTAEQAV